MRSSTDTKLAGLDWGNLLNNRIVAKIIENPKDKYIPLCNNIWKLAPVPIKSDHIIGKLNAIKSNRLATFPLTKKMDIAKTPNKIINVTA